jgi:Tol biopolymer transport system component
MGEVYRAHDTRLRRDVAVKALPASFAEDQERVLRFEREARILAGLNHPSIAAIYGMEQLGDSRYLILELVDGGTLADRLAAGAIPMRESLRLARDVADALHTAHESGVVHRDLKPSNIALTPDGRPKVLDFGLAKSAAATSAATTVVHATLEGTVLGTAPYMSPEQTRGGRVDKRTDVWGFGCVLYEMLTGHPPFTGATTSDIVVAILEKDPDYHHLPPDTPAGVRRLLRRCLARDVSHRLHDLADARIELDEALAKPGSPATEPESTRRLSRREAAAWLLAAASIVIAAALWTLNRPAPVVREAVPVLRVPLALPADLRFTSPDPATRFVLSPDGTRLALVAADARGTPMLWIRPLNATGAHPIPGTEGASFPFWSPDSKSIAYLSRPVRGGVVGGNARLLRIDLEGGPPTTLADRAFIASGAWGPGDVILFTPTGNAPLHRISAASPGPPEPVGELDVQSGDLQHSFPSFLPDGRHVVYTVIGSTKGANEARGVYIRALDGNDPPRLLLPAASHARYASGHLVFLRDATLFAQRFDAATLTLHDDARPIAEHLQITNRLSGGTGAFSVSDAGVLVFQTGIGVRSQLAWMDRRTRTTTPIGEQADYHDVRLSPDGTRAAVSMLDPQVGTRDLWVYDLARRIPQRLTLEPSDEFAPVWSPTGDRMAYTSTRDGSIQIYEQAVNGPAEPRQVDSGKSILGKFAAAWSPDGTWLLFIAGGRALAQSDLHKVSMASPSTSTPFIDTPYVESQVRFSHDGKWIAYSSNDSGRMEVVIRAFPEGTPTRVSVNGGGWPTWRADGKELFYLAPDGALMAAALSPAADVQVGDSRPLFNVRLRPTGRLDAYPYDVTADGQQFLLNTFVEEAASTGLTLLVNWPHLMK